MGIKLYGFDMSPPSQAARLMLERKGLDYKMVTLLPGMHPALLRTRGFSGGTVPGMKLDGKKIQNSRAISRALEQLQPDPPLFPQDAEQRLAVEEAERWGEEDLQDVPRRIVRWLAVHRPETRELIARDVGIPLPKLAAWINAPVAKRMANKVNADDEIQEAIADVSTSLDRVDGLIADGVIGGSEPNAADCQLAPNVRALMTVQDLEPLVDGRPSAELATRLVPEIGAPLPPGLLPEEWIRQTARS